MINELFSLSNTMKNMEIQTDSWHREFKPIPNIKPNAPCVRIVFLDQHISFLEEIDSEMGKKLRKYGNNQGTFPAMNLAPLYRIVDEEKKKKLGRLYQSKGDGLKLDEIKSWCADLDNNWDNKKFANKYKNCMKEIPKKMEQMLQGNAAYEPVLKLIQEIDYFGDPKILHRELEKKVFEMLEQHENVILALHILFYEGKMNKSAADDYGSLSVILDSEVLEEEGNSSAGISFMRGLNKALLSAEKNKQDSVEMSEIDAFGEKFAPSEEPMPMVKLAGGFEVSLRTMFKGQPCQKRYDRIGNATFPIGSKMRMQLKDALTWLASEEQKDKTWVGTDKNEILFAYPSQLQPLPVSFTRQFGLSRNKQNVKARFETESSDFVEYITKTKKSDPENYPRNIQIFILRKLDKARTKVVYTRCTSPDEIIMCNDEWQKSADNIPNLRIGKLTVPFPLHIFEIMNWSWKQDGTLVTDKLKKIPAYHGMELLFGVEKNVLAEDLHFLITNTTNMAIYAGKKMNLTTASDMKDPFKIKDTLVLFGMLLYWLGIRKEKYMNEYPYLIGQLLKVSDSLHELYCYEVRDKQIPPQLVGNSLYIAATEMPAAALAQLANRVMPYVAWATKNKEQKIVITKKNKDGEKVEYKGPSAGYLLYLYEQIATKLANIMNPQTRFNDMEKAQMFIGYLANFPKKDQDNKGGTDNE
ncbi:MAG: hypothetical protein ACI4HI_04550 [Lachnospiraceae bacterium]